MTRTPILITLSLLLACGGQTLDVGSNRRSDASAASESGGASNAMAGAGYDCPGQRPSLGASGGSGPVIVQPVPPWPDSESCPSDLGTLEGTWSGHVLGGTGSLPDFHITLEPGAVTRCRTLTFGAPMSYAPATDPEASYPIEGPPFFLGPLPGFSYTLLQATLEDSDIRFAINFAEPYRSWCELQTPYCDLEYGGYYCSRAVSYEQASDGRCMGLDSRGKSLGAVPCWQAVGCRGGGPMDRSFCVCDGNGCSASQDGNGLISFDFHVVGDDAQGVVNGGPAYLTRD